CRRTRGPGPRRVFPPSKGGARERLGNLAYEPKRAEWKRQSVARTQCRIRLQQKFPASDGSPGRAAKHPIEWSARGCTAFDVECSRSASSPFKARLPVHRVRAKPDGRRDRSTLRSSHFFERS